jgi:uncharacterized protein YndB with AHSA1/START domain
MNDSTHPQTLQDRTLRFHFSDGPMRGKAFDHTFHPDGTVTWQGADGVKNRADNAAIEKIGDECFVGSYLGTKGYTLTTVFNLETGALVSFASDGKEWSEHHGRVELLDSRRTGQGSTTARDSSNLGVAMTDRIYKKIVLHASHQRVWEAISEADQFGTWFGVAFDGPFIEGHAMTGHIVTTRVDAEVAAMQKPHVGKPFEFVVERIEPMQRISFRWHPFAMEPGVDYSREPMTLIVFELQDVADGVLLKITESGFDKIPVERRAKAYEANDGGWEKQAMLVQKYLAMHVDA